MKLDFYFFSLEVKVNAGSFAASRWGKGAKALMGPTSSIEMTSQKAVADNLSAAWNKLLYEWEVAPEALKNTTGLGGAGSGRKPCVGLDEVLKSALAGSALSVLENKGNPLAEIKWASGGALGTPWDALAHKIYSARAMEEESPYREARALAAPDIGKYDGVVGKDGDFNTNLSSVLKGLNWAPLVAKVDELARRAEITLLGSVAKAPAHGAKSTLRM